MLADAPGRRPDVDNPPMKQPILLALAAGLLVLLVAFAAPLWHWASGAAARAEQGLPWQVQAGADGTLQVFGLRLGHDVLADAQARIGSGLQVALVARLGEVGRLEALADPFAAGFVSGRLVLAFDVPAATLQRWRARASGSAPMDGGVRRFALQAADQGEAGRAALVGLSFVPALRLTEADVRQRFGAPQAEVAGGMAPGRAGPGAKVLLYPAIGLAVSLAPGNRSVLQYVAPAEFEARLRGPLAASGPAPASVSAPQSSPADTLPGRSAGAQNPASEADTGQEAQLCGLILG